MDKTGPIIIIEDDEDDRDFFKEAFQILNYKMKLSTSKMVKARWRS